MKILQDDPSYILLQGLDDLKQVLAEVKAAGELVFDLETTGLNTTTAKIVGIGFGYRARSAYYLPVLGEGWSLDWPKVRALIKPIFEDPEIKLHGHNILAYDAQVLYWNGVRCQGLQDDTLAAFRVLQSEYFPAGLDPLTLRYFNYVKIPTSRIIGTGRKKRTMDTLPIEVVGKYCCEDIDFSYRLREAILQNLKRAGLWEFYLRFRKIIPILFDMYVDGITLDINKLKQFDSDLEIQISRITKKLAEIAGEDFNPNSTDHKAKLLYDTLKLDKVHKIKIPKTPTGKRRVTADIISELAELEGPDSVPDLLHKYAKLNKVRSTYSQGYLKLAVKHGNIYKIHPTFRPDTVSTGRLSCTAPNLQNIPRPDNDKEGLGKTLRSLFIASPGYKLVGGDLSQAELRILTHYSQDHFMLECYKNGLDIHTMMAGRIFKVAKPTKAQRSSVKTITFGIIYGMGPSRLAHQLGVPFHEAQDLIQMYFDSFPGIKDYLDAAITFAREHGYVPNLFGRRRYIPYITSPNPGVRTHARNCAVNHPIQSSVAHMIERAMASIDEEFASGHFDGRIVLQVHDEIVTEVKEDQAEAWAKRMKEIMENTAELTVPMVSDIGIGNTIGELK